jgi:hypothetical protein
MTKQAWKEHMHSLGLVAERSPHPDDPETARALAHMAGCEVCQARKRQAQTNRNRRERYSVMRSLGMTKTPYGWE